MTIYTLLKSSPSKGNHTVKFGQLIGNDKVTLFIKIHAEIEAGM